MLGSASCKRAPERLSSPSPATKTEPAAATPDADPKSPPAKHFSQEDVDALVDRWMQAQDRGDFATYEQLYARRMLGIKRVGTRVSTMDRDAWMVDRRRMFKKPMIVSVDALTFRSRGGRIVVEFTQFWSQGKFKDRGRKELIIVEEDGALRIAREEMLQSEVAADSRLAETFLPVIRTGEHSYVLLRESVEIEWGDGPFTQTKSEGIDIIYLQRAKDALPPEVAAWRGRKLTVHGIEGTPCEAAIEDLHLFAGATGSFHVDEESDHHGSDDQAIAPLAFAKRRPSLVGRLDGCNGTFALPKPLAPTGIYRPQPIEASLERRALAAAEALPYYLDRHLELIVALEGDGLSRAEAEAEAGAHPWAGGRTVKSFSGPNGERFVTVSISSDQASLISGAMLAIFSVASDGKLQLLNESVHSYLAPTLLLDVNGDGRLELIEGDNGGSGLALYTMQFGSIVQVAVVPYFMGECDC